MTFTLVEIASETPWGTPEHRYNFLVLEFHDVEALEAQVTNPDSPITGVVRVPVDLVETYQGILQVES